jgi:hypothetical protein
MPHTSPDPKLAAASAATSTSAANLLIPQNHPRTFPQQLRHPCCEQHPQKCHVLRHRGQIGQPISQCPQWLHASHHTCSDGPSSTARTNSVGQFLCRRDNQRHRTPTQIQSHDGYALLLVQDWVGQDQFIVYWRQGSNNLGDYFTKHDLIAHHRKIGPTYLHIAKQRTNTMLGPISSSKPFLARVCSSLSGFPIPGSSLWIPYNTKQLFT